MKELTPEERLSMTKKKAFLNEIASQFRPQEVILSMKFNGYGINHDGGGFTTDISETCHWLTPFVLEPVNGYDLTYKEYQLIFNSFTDFHLFSTVK